MRPNKKLTPRRKLILDFINQFIQESGIPPTVRDIQAACGISSTSVVDYNLRLLQRDGYLRRKAEVARGIELLDESGNPVSAAPRVQVIGYIAAGEPLPATTSDGWSPQEPLETLEIPPDMFRGKRDMYALKVKGQSMTDALVDDGDVVLVEPSREAHNGDMVVARLKLEDETTLKRLYLEGNKVRLQPANSQMEPIYSMADNVEIQGRVVGIIRTID